MPKVTVPTCHIEKLKQLGIYDQWLSNIKSYFELEQNYYKSFSGNSWTYFIGRSFSWKESAEGVDYWYEIEQK